MSALPHLATVGALLSTHSVPHLQTSLLSGLSMVGIFALMLGAGYLATRPSLAGPQQAPASLGGGR